MSLSRAQMTAHAVADEARETATPEPVTDGSDHEKVLIRHGLISHILQFSPVVASEEAGELLAEVTQGAQNVIRLSGRRYGVLWEKPPRLEGATDAYAVYAVSLSADDIAPLDGDARSTAHSADDPETEGPLRAGPSIEMPAPIENSRLDALEARLAEIAAQLSVITPDAVAGHVVPIIDELLTRRIETAERTFTQVDKMQADWRREIAGFWEGMEAALRLMNGAAETVSEKAHVLKTKQKPDDQVAEVRRVLEAQGEELAERFETERAQGAAVLEAIKAELEEQADAIATGQNELLRSMVSIPEGLDAKAEARATALADRISKTLAPLAKVPAGVEQVLDAISSMPRPENAKAIASLQQDFGVLRDDIQALIDQVRNLETSSNPVGAAVAAHSHDLVVLRKLVTSLDEKLNTHDAVLSAVARDVGTLAAAPALPPAEIAEPSPAFEAMIQGLSDRLEARGGVLTDSVETACRSMKNFWLASEDATQRLNAAIDRVAESYAGPEDALDEVGQRLAALETLQAAEEQRAKAVRVAIAELSASQVMKAAKPDQDA